MNKMISVSKRLDTVFKVMGILLSIVLVACFVGIAIIAVGLIFKLPPELIGTGYASLSLGLAEIQVADAFAPDYKKVLFVVAMLLLLMLRWPASCGGLPIRAVVHPRGRKDARRRQRRQGSVPSD